MSKFPEALPLSRHITKQRLIRRKTVLMAARRGILFRGLLIAIELLGCLIWGSSALFVDALSGSMDLLASFALIWCIRRADVPPDENHPFGHGRFEPVAGLFIGFLLVFLGVFSGYEQMRLFSSHTLAGAGFFPFAWLIPCLGVLFLELSYQRAKKAAKKENSPALMADAVHYRIDALGSLFALIALGLAAFFPSKAHLFDHAGALFISILMICVGGVAIKKNLHQLLDQTPDKSYFHTVREAALSVEGVLATEKLRLQSYGPDAHVAIDIEVEPHQSVEEAHALTQQVRRKIQMAWPAVRDVIVHVEPYYPGDHENG